MDIARNWRLKTSRSHLLATRSQSDHSVVLPHNGVLRALRTDTTLYRFESSETHSSWSGPEKNLRNSLYANTPDALLPIIRQHFRALLDDRGDWNPSIYDLAWVLCSDFFSARDRQKQIETLIACQNADATWGDASYVPHSAVVDTLAAVMALVTLGEPIPHSEELAHSLDALLCQCSVYPHHDTVAFEIITPHLLDWLEQHGIEFPLSAQASEFIHKNMLKASKKLALLRQGPGLFDAGITLSYTAELAALIPLDDSEIDQLTGMMLPNGAIGLSPSATAAVIMVLRQHHKPVPEELYHYLDATFDDYEEGAFPDLHPITTSRRLWNILPWLVSGNIFAIIHDRETLDLLTEMYQAINFDELGRVSWDLNNSALPDLDDTAVAFALHAVLSQAGVEGLQPASSHSFQYFQRKDGSLFCYPYELHPSPAAILHTLMAMHMAADTFGSEFTGHPYNQAIVQSLITQLDPTGHTLDQLGHDKWHATWTYGIERWLSLDAIREVYPDEVRTLLHEVLEREQNGGWGQKCPTLEETAYVVSGLVSLLKDQRLAITHAEQHAIEDALERALLFMATAIHDGPDLPPIWISKNLYAPKFQIVSAVLDALYGLLAIQTPAPSMYHDHAEDVSFTSSTDALTAPQESTEPY